ncbi:MAG: prepilin-type N-terminal cleavage/methylation domain-containing protein, partial [Acidimicrobiales bacterium]
MAQEVVARGSRGPRRARPRRHGDAGFTLVEVVIAFAVMAIAMAAMVPLVWGSLASAAVANHRTTANGLAVQATENLRAVAYDELGFTSSAGVPSSCGGANPVTNVAASGIPPTDESAQTVGPLTYTTTSCVYWVDSSASPTYSQAYKQTVVAVTWTDSGGSHSVQQVSDVYPGGQGPYTVADNNYGSATTTTAPPSGTPSAPTLTSAVDEMAPNDTGDIDVGWSAPSSTPVAISYYVVDYSTTSTFVSGSYAESPEVTGNGSTFT